VCKQLNNVMLQLSFFADGVIRPVNFPAEQLEGIVKYTTSYFQSTLARRDGHCNFSANRGFI